MHMLSESMLVEGAVDLGRLERERRHSERDRRVQVRLLDFEFKLDPREFGIGSPLLTKGSGLMTPPLTPPASLPSLRWKDASSIDLERSCNLLVQEYRWGRERLGP